MIVHKKYDGPYNYLWRILINVSCKWFYMKWNTLFLYGYMEIAHYWINDLIYCTIRKLRNGNLEGLGDCTMGRFNDGNIKK